MTKSRRHRRVRYTELVQFYLGDELLSARASNLSLGGVALDCSRAIPTESELRVYLPLRFRSRPGSRFCAVTGTAVWQSTGRIGVRFDDLPDETVDQIEQFVCVQAV